MIDFGDSLIEGTKEKIHDSIEEDKGEEEGFVEFKPTDDSEEDEGYSPGKEYWGTFVGTPLYVAPEMLKRTVSGHFTDIWALGCIIYEMATGDVPFWGQNDYTTFDLIMQLDIKWPSDLNPLIKNLVQELLVIEPMERLGAGLEGSKWTFKELKAHPFFKGVNWDQISTSNDLPFNTEDILTQL